MKVGVLSRMCGMGDILIDDMAYYQQHRRRNLQRHRRLRLYADAGRDQGGQIDAQIEKDRATFAMDPKLSYESHTPRPSSCIWASNAMAGPTESFGAFTAQFDIFGDDKRFQTACRSTRLHS